MQIFDPVVEPVNALDGLLGRLSRYLHSLITCTEFTKLAMESLQRLDADHAAGTLLHTLREVKRSFQSDLVTVGGDIDMRKKFQAALKRVRSLFTHSVRV